MAGHDEPAQAAEPSGHEFAGAGPTGTPHGRDETDSAARPHGEIDRKMLLALMGQALGACVVSGCQTYFRIGLSWAGFGSTVVRNLGSILRQSGSDDGSRRAVLDDSIAHLREVGELSAQEARLLQRNLAQISLRLRDLESASYDEPQRHAKSKK